MKRKYLSLAFACALLLLLVLTGPPAFAYDNVHGHSDISTKAKVGLDLVYDQSLYAGNPDVTANFPELQWRTATYGRSVVLSVTPEGFYVTGWKITGNGALSGNTVSWSNRFDDEDVLWQRGTNSFGIPLQLFTHFWDADTPQGAVKENWFTVPTPLGGLTLLGPYQNNWKAMSILWHRALECWRMSKLVDGPQRSVGETLTNEEIANDPDYWRTEAYKYLGCCAHVLADNNIPTHVREDYHAFDDDYERFVQNRTYEMSPPPAWVQRDGLFDLPSNELIAADLVAAAYPFQSWDSDDPRYDMDDPNLGWSTRDARTKLGRDNIYKLFYLTYTSNQAADYFGSDEAWGDAVDPIGWMDGFVGFPQPQGEWSLPAPSPFAFTAEHLKVIEDFEYTRAMRAVATLYSLFKETVDDAAPTVGAEITGPMGDNGWYTGVTSVNANVGVDNAYGSGVWRDLAGMTDQNGQEVVGYENAKWRLKEGVFKLNLLSIDWCGNEGRGQRTIKIDATPPTISIACPQPEQVFYLGSAVTASWSVDDNLSGIASASGTVPSGGLVDTGSLGTKSISVEGTDLAGHAASAAVTYYVRYVTTGLLEPVNADGSSIFKTGSTLPLKVRLSDAGGTPCTSAVIRVSLAKIGDGIVGDEVEAVSSAAADSGNTFRSLGDGSYMFNLSTRSLTQGTYRLRVTYDDGSSTDTLISLKK